MLFSIAGGLVGALGRQAPDALRRIYLVMMLSPVDGRPAIWFGAWPIRLRAGLMLLVAVEVPVGDVSLGAQRWLNLGRCASSRPRS
jgi:cell division protein FtsW (lipid II flippase)